VHVPTPCHSAEVSSVAACGMYNAQTRLLGCCWFSGEGASW